MQLLIDNAQALRRAADLASIARTLREVHDELGSFMVSALTLSALTDWQSPAARGFHQRAEDWCAQVTNLRHAVDGAHDCARRASARAADVAMRGGS